MIILLFNFTKTPILWDETSHLNSGTLLYFGQYNTFMGYAFYPPLFDVLVFISYKVFGIGLFAARLPAVCFSGLALWAVFELAYYLYNGKVALLSAVILGIMPGVFWLSGYAMLETVLMFFVTVALLCFYRWIVTRRDRMLLFVGLALGLGFLAKYQMLVVGVVMLLGIVLFAQKSLMAAFRRFSLAIVAAVLVVLPWILVAYNVYRNEMLSQWFYAMAVGNPERSVYSTRFPIPIFYFIEVVWPYSHFHPISVFVYTLCLAGLVFMFLRHRCADKFVLLWFVVIFVFFTVISNREWRYVVSLFPALAISAAVAILAFGGVLRRAWKKSFSVSKRCLVKVFSVIVTVMVVGAMLYSVYDAYTFVSGQQVVIDINGAANYVTTNIEFGRSVMVLCPVNFFNHDVVQFYLWAQGDRFTDVLHYPTLPADAYTPDFNVLELVELCKENNVQYVLLFEYGDMNMPYFGTDLNCQKVYEQLCYSGSFLQVTEEQTFGDSPRQIFVITFTG
jgi:4-amino-4-deoxy-L-arabinose transferase-like glycosyltransferase